MAVWSKQTTRNKIRPGAGLYGMPISLIASAESCAGLGRATQTATAMQAMSRTRPQLGVLVARHGFRSQPVLAPGLVRRYDADDADRDSPDAPGRVADHRPCAGHHQGEAMRLIRLYAA